MDRVDRIVQLILRKKTALLSEKEQQELEAWLSENPLNEDLMEQWEKGEFLQKNFSRYNRLDVGTAIGNMKVRISAQSSRRPSRKIGIRLPAVAAVVICIITTALFIRYQLQDSPETVSDFPANRVVLSIADRQPIPLGNQDDETAWRHHLEKTKSADISADSAVPLKISVMRGGEYKLCLDDGTVVWLNSESEFEYPETFSEKERRVKLSGEAYFEVQKDPERAFIVESGGTSVKVLGTTFNLSAYANDPAVVTTLVSGKVEVQTGKENRILTPGRQAIVDKESNTVSVHEVDTRLYTAWIQGVFEFDGMPLQDITNRLSRWYDVQFEFRDNCGEEHFTGAFWKYQPLESFLKDIESVTNVVFTPVDKKIIVTRK